MKHKNTFEKILCTLTTAAASTILYSSNALAHTGHSHAQHDKLDGILHTLTTHPLLFSVVGLALITVAYISRD